MEDSQPSDIPSARSMVIVDPCLAYYMAWNNNMLHCPYSISAFDNFNVISLSTVL